MSTIFDTQKILKGIASRNHLVLIHFAHLFMHYPSLVGPICQIVPTLPVFYIRKKAAKNCQHFIGGGKILLLFRTGSITRIQVNVNSSQSSPPVSARVTHWF